VIQFKRVSTRVRLWHGRRYRIAFRAHWRPALIVDSVSWCLSASGSFNVRLAYRALFRGPLFLKHPCFGKPRSSSRLRSFVCQLLRDRIPLGVEVFKWARGDVPVVCGARVHDSDYVLMSGSPVFTELLPWGSRTWVVGTRPWWVPDNKCKSYR
jgi:hypothetical protein